MRIRGDTRIPRMGARANALAPIFFAFLNNPEKWIIEKSKMKSAIDYRANFFARLNDMRLESLARMGNELKTQKEKPGKGAKLLAVNKVWLWVNILLSIS